MDDVHCIKVWYSIRTSVLLSEGNLHRAFQNRRTSSVLIEFGTQVITNRLSITYIFNIGIIMSAYFHCTK